MRHIRGRSGNKFRHTLFWESPVELVDVVTKAGIAGHLRRHLGTVTCRGKRIKSGGVLDPWDWYGREDLHDWNDVRRASMELWNSGAERVQTLLGKIETIKFATPHSIVRRQKWREDDGDFDLDKYLDGVPCYLGTVRRTSVGRQFVTLVIDVASNSGTLAGSMYWRASAGIAAAHVLEENGYAVEMLAVTSAVNVLEPPEDVPCGRDKHGYLQRPPKQDMFTAMWLKRADDPLDVGTISSVCSPWFFRTVCFGSFVIVPGTTPDDGLGSSVRVRRELVDEIIGPGEKILIEGVWSESQAVELVRETLQRFADPDWLADHSEPAWG